MICTGLDCLAHATRRVAIEGVPSPYCETCASVLIRHGGERDMGPIERDKYGPVPCPCGLFTFCNDDCHPLGELTNPKDIASFEEWGHAAIAPTEKPAQPLGMFPWTP